MNVCYIKQSKQREDFLNENEKYLPKFFRNVIYHFKSFFNILNIQELENKLICFIPYKTLDNKYIEKLVYNIEKLLKKKQIRNVVLSEDLRELETKFSTVNILNGRWLFQFLLYDILIYIAQKKNTDLAKLDISVLVNNVDDLIMPNLNLLVHNVKSLSIVTNSFEKFKVFEQNLYSNYGIMISIANNKRKSLSKSNIIINFDFTEEILKQYSINPKAIIINVKNKIKKHNKRFNGININNCNIILNKNLIDSFNQDKLYNYFDSNILYESIVYRKDNFRNIRDEIIKDKIKIYKLIGNNSVISDEEFIKSN